MLIHLCRRCGFESQIFQSYVDHLWGDLHQRQTRASFLNWSGDDNLKSLVVYAPSKIPPPKPSGIINLFQKQSVVVVDFVNWPETSRMFIVQFMEKDEVDKMLRLLQEKSGALTIGNEYIQLRRKSDVLQNEWSILLGTGTADEGASKEPTLIELSSDDEVTVGPSPSDASSNRSHVSRNEAESNSKTSHSNQDNIINIQPSSSATPTPTSSSEYNSDVEMEIMTPTPPANVSSVVDLTDMDCNGFAQGAPISSLTISTKMGDTFYSEFLSKVKKNDIPDSKATVKQNMALMAKTWCEIYFDYHNKLWPACFSMTNTKLGFQTMEGVGVNLSFRCRCRCTEYNAWFRELPESAKKCDKLAKRKATEIRRILQKPAKCNEKMKQFEKSKRAPEPILNFKCDILITYNNGNNTTPNISANMTIKCIKGENAEMKIKVLKSIFIENFRDFETNSIRKWSVDQPKQSPEVFRRWDNLSFPD